MRYFDTRTYFVARTNDYREINDRLVCEQVFWLGFGVCFGGGATSGSWQEEWGVGGEGGERGREASLHAHPFRPLRGVKILSNRNNAKCQQN